MDYTRLIKRLEPEPDGESAVRHRSAVVTAVNADGTIDIDLSGVPVTGVSTLDYAGVGQVVQVVAWQGDLLAIGSAQTSQAPLRSQLTDRVSDSGGVVIGTVMTTVLQASIDIPAEWVTYDLEAYCSCLLNDTSGGSTGSTLITSQVIDPAGTFNEIITHEIEAQNNHDINNFAQVAFVEGRAGVGQTRLITWQMQRAAVNTTSATRTTLIVKALRVT